MGTGHKSCHNYSISLSSRARSKTPENVSPTWTSVLASYVYKLHKHMYRVKMAEED